MFSRTSPGRCTGLVCPAPFLPEWRGLKTWAELVHTQSTDRVKVERSHLCAQMQGYDGDRKRTDGHLRANPPAGAANLCGCRCRWLEAGSRAWETWGHWKGESCVRADSNHPLMVVGKPFTFANIGASQHPRSTGQCSWLSLRIFFPIVANSGLVVEIQPLNC